MRRIAAVSALLVLAGTVACKGRDSTSTTISEPGPTPVSPTGTIQGRLTDRVTQQPIVGALASVGVASATTDANGQFVIPNVPATRDALNGTVTGTYLVTLDLQRVTSPVAMSTNPAVAYPKFSYASVSVAYTSLDDTNGTQPGAGSGTDGDTPVVGLVATVDLRVAKLAARIEGVVYGCETSASTALEPVGAGYTVRLLSAGSDNSGSGAAEYVVATTATDDAGQFTFDYVESLRTFSVEAQDAGNVYTDRVSGVSSRADGLTRSVVLNACSTDRAGPAVIAFSPELYADVAPASSTVVTLTFSEPVVQDWQTSTTPGLAGNLYDALQVVYAGDKGGNLAYRVDWNARYDQLSITFATASSGRYFVRLRNIDGGKLRDRFGNVATMGVCPDDAAIPASLTNIGWFGGFDTGANDCLLYFTTGGGPAAAAPTSVVVVNANAIDGTGTAPQLDWLPAAGARSYNVYRTCTRWPATLNEPGPQVFLGNATTTDFTDAALALVEGGSIPLACTYTVKSVSADRIENPAGASVTVADALAPPISAATAPGLPIVGAAPPAQYGDPRNQLTIAFGEDLAEAAAETIANYAFTARPGGTTAGALWPAPVVASIDYTARAARFTFSALGYAIVPTPGVCPAGLTPATGDVALIPPGSPTCIAAGLDATLSSTVAATDVPCAGGICAGADLVCDSIRAGDDVVVTRTGGTPRCIASATPTGILATARVTGTVLLPSIAAVTVLPAVTDVAGNPFSPNQDTVRMGTLGAPTIGP